MDEMPLAASYILYNNTGRNIIDIPAFLCKLLKKTDIGDVCIDNVMLPFNTVYVHFGECIAFRIQGKDSRVEGAYVTKIEIDDIMLLEFTLILTECSRRYIKFSFQGEKGGGVSIMNALIDISLSNKVGDTVSGSYADILVCLKKYSHDDFSSEICRIIRESAELIINAILFFINREKDVRLSTTDMRATNLLQQLGERKKSQERTKIIQKLSKFSYSKIFILGENLKKEYECMWTGKEVAPHWRRGHWRHQPYGQGLAENKLIWINPTIVRRDKGKPEKGHVYEF